MKAYRVNTTINLVVDEERIQQATGSDPKKAIQGAIAVVLSSLSDMFTIDFNQPEEFEMDFKIGEPVELKEPSKQ